jgi:glucose/mannose-6-phosphate isomerase
MEELITKFGDQLEESFKIARNYTFKHKISPITNVVFTGMGGSGIGSKIVAQWIEKEIKVPVTFVQNYEIPSWVQAGCLVIASSYSGNTEETLSSVKLSHERGAHIVGICSGGELAAFCAQHNMDCILVPPGLPPRSALAYSLVQQLSILIWHKLISEAAYVQLNACNAFLVQHQTEIKQLAKEIVPTINNTNLVIYAEANYESVAVRAKQQINENSKFLCRHHSIPEMNHNELLGWGCGNSNHAALFLYTAGMHRQNSKRFELTREIVSRKTDKVLSLYAKGANQIEQSMYLIHLLDWVSLYLGYERNEDVVEIENINYLKEELAKN